MLEQISCVYRIYKSNAKNQHYSQCKSGIWTYTLLWVYHFSNPNVKLRTRAPRWPSRHACAGCARTNPRVMGPRDSKYQNGCMRSGKNGIIWRWPLSSKTAISTRTVREPNICFQTCMHILIATSPKGQLILIQHPW